MRGTVGRRLPLIAVCGRGDAACRSGVGNLGLTGDPCGVTVDTFCDTKLSVNCRVVGRCILPLIAVCGRGDAACCSGVGNLGLTGDLNRSTRIHLFQRV